MTSRWSKDHDAAGAARAESPPLPRPNAKTRRLPVVLGVVLAVVLAYTDSAVNRATPSTMTLAAVMVPVRLTHQCSSLEALLMVNVGCSLRRTRSDRRAMQVRHFRFCHPSVSHSV